MARRSAVFARLEGFLFPLVPVIALVFVFVVASEAPVESEWCEGDTGVLGPEEDPSDDGDLAEAVAGGGDGMTIGRVMAIKFGVIAIGGCLCRVLASRARAIINLGR